MGLAWAIFITMHVDELVRWCAAQPAIPRGFWNGLREALGENPAGVSLVFSALAAAFSLPGMPEDTERPTKRPRVVEHPSALVVSAGEYWVTDTLRQDGNGNEKSYFRVDKVNGIDNTTLQASITWIYTLDQTREVLDEEGGNTNSHALPVNGYLTSTHCDDAAELALDSITRAKIMDADITGLLILGPPSHVVDFTHTSSRHRDVATQMLMRGSQTTRGAVELVNGLEKEIPLRTFTWRLGDSTGTCYMCKQSRTLAKGAWVGDRRVLVGNTCFRALTSAHKLLHSTTSADWNNAIGMYAKAFNDE